MRRMLISRISRRVLAEHHLALSASFHDQAEKTVSAERHVGIIYTGLNVKTNIDRCAQLLQNTFCPQYVAGSHVWPEVVVDGHVDTSFAYIKEHLEYVPASIRFSPRSPDLVHRYILFELLKNASAIHQHAC